MSMYFPRHVPHEARTLARIEAYSTPVPECGCWLWLGGYNGDGYGLTSYRGKNITAHRAAFMLLVGAIPTGVEVCHKCDTPSCCNPDHLFLATHGENMRDAYRKRRRTQQGHHNGNARLSPSEVREIRSSVEGSSVLQARYGISKSSVYAIRSRLNWRHVA